MSLPLIILAQAEASIITNVPNRNTISLDGKWHYLIEPYENGFYDDRREPFDNRTNPGGSAYFTNVKAEKKTDRVEYDFSKAPMLMVPGSWVYPLDSGRLQIAKKEPPHHSERVEPKRYYWRRRA